MALAPVPAHPSRLVFLGTPALAVPVLESLVQHGHDVALVITRADKRRGRGSTLTPSPVKAAADALGLPVAHQVDAALDVGADLGVVVAFGQLIRPHVLERLPMINLHFSLLPRWRGAAPVERAILAGDDETGACVMQVEEGLDTGPVFGCERVPITPRTTVEGLQPELVRIGTDLLLRQLAEGLGVPAPQIGEATYAAKIESADLLLDWASPALQLDRQVRVGGAHTVFRAHRLKVLAAEPDPDLAAGSAAPLAPGELDGDRVGTGEDTLRLLTVQPEGKAAMAASDWRNGARVQPGERLGT
jgi:methionyl-tRNA formyltransferase